MKKHRQANSHTVITTASGHSILIDTVDLPLLCGKKPFVSDRGSTKYASVTISGNKHLLHRLIAEPKPQQQVDHINRNSLDNRRSNLRVCTASFNQQNKRPKGLVRFKGVFRSKGRFRAVIQKDGIKRSLGYFDTPEEAAAAYNEAALDLYGNQASLNVLSA